MYKLSHVCLYVFDQDEARDFYTRSSASRSARTSRSRATAG